MGAVIDTCVLIDLERRKKLDGLAALESGRLYVSPISICELQIGVEYATSPQVRTAREAFLGFVLESFQIDDMSAAIAQKAGRIMYELQSTGQRIGKHDSWIAAYARHLDVPVVTSNVAHFKRVLGLEVVAWT